ncbi:Ankyrin repeat domain-containing protein 13D [Armadillidium vulgare]|nr:Ankyrin repeat domain-containing protein 13D [Armadillidium vulgare]
MASVPEKTDILRSQYPVHFAVWHNDYEGLLEVLEKKSNNLEEHDPRGRTPLMLAVTLGHLESVRLLLRHGCCVTVENKDGWTVVQEATATGDPELLKTVLESRDLQRFSSRVLGIPNLLLKLSEVKYFNLETDGTVYVELIENMDENELVNQMKPHQAIITHRLKSPIVTTFIDTDKISFERDKRGIWGWRNDRSEIVNGHECKVFSASNVELVTKTRTEHLTEVDKQQNSSPVSPIQSFLNLAEVEEKQNVAQSNGEEELKSFCNNPSNITVEEYFDPSVDLEGRDIGRPKEITSKIQKFKVILKIPLFHVLTARITFGNIFGLDETVDKVTTFKEGERLSCVIEDSVFEAPSTYSVIGAGDAIGHHRQIGGIDDDDALLQYAIQQSILETSSGNNPCEDQARLFILISIFGKPFKALRRLHQEVPQISMFLPLHLFKVLQIICPSQLLRKLSYKVKSGLMDVPKAIEESLAMSQQCMVLNPNNGEDETEEAPIDSDMALALSLSQKQQEEEDKRRKDEEDMLKRVLELSLKEK